MGSQNSQNYLYSQSIDPPNACTDQNNECSNAYNGSGTCVNITDSDWEELAHNFDLSKPDVPGACQKSNADGCCRCFKNKTCVDNGCKDAFEGYGVCLDLKDEMIEYDFDLAAGHDPQPDLCKHNLGGKAFTSLLQHHL